MDRVVVGRASCIRSQFDRRNWHARFHYGHPVAAAAGHGQRGCLRRMLASSCLDGELAFYQAALPAR